MTTGLLRGFNPTVKQGIVALALTSLMASPVFANEGISQMVDRLCAANNIPRSAVKQTVIKNSSQINAGTDGKSIVVYSALWEQLGTDDARAFVVGHELGHIVLNHVTKGQGRRIGMQVLGRLAASYLSPIAGTATYYGLQLTDLKFDRGQEYQADEEGLRLMWKAGYDPHAMNRVFSVLSQSDKGSGGPEFLRTHPLSQKRLEGLLVKYDRLGPPTRQNGGIGVTSSLPTATFAQQSPTGFVSPSSPPGYPMPAANPVAQQQQPYGNRYNATPPPPPQPLF